MDTGILLTAVLLVGFGFINCFFGYRIFGILLFIWGFLAGAGLAVALLVNSASPVVVLIAAVIAGVVGALLMRLLYSIAVFVMGAMFGIIIGAALMSLLGITDPGGIGMLVLLVAAIVGGILALAVQKLMLILATSFSGAAGMVHGVLLLVPGAYTITSVATGSGSSIAAALHPDYTTVSILGTLVLGVIGVLVQYRAGRKAM